MKTIILTIVLIALRLAATACELCEKQQPKLLRGITHGTGPQSNWDYVIVWIAVVIVLVTLSFSVKWLIRPGEKSADHIKRLILNND